MWMLCKDTSLSLVGHVEKTSASCCMLNTSDPTQSLLFYYKKQFNAHCRILRGCVIYVRRTTGMVSVATNVTNGYWINNVDQSWESHHTDCLLAGIAEPKHNYRLIKFGSRYRRRINTEEKAKVAAAVGLAELIKFLAARAILPRTTLKNRTNSTSSFNSSWCSSSYSSNRPCKTAP